MRIKSKEEVMAHYEARYPELDNYFKKQLSEEYDRYFAKIKDLQTLEAVDEFFRKEIETNEQLFQDNAYMEGLEGEVSEHFMSVLAAYGLIVFFRDNMIER